MGKISFLSFLSLLLLLPVGLVLGQDEIKIKAKVTDIKGDPLIGANVIVLNTSYGSSTEWNGSYFIDLPESEKEEEVMLEARYVGYISKSISITLKSETTTSKFHFRRRCSFFKNCYRDCSKT